MYRDFKNDIKSKKAEYIVVRNVDNYGNLKSSIEKTYKNIYKTKQFVLKKRIESTKNND